MPRTRRDVWKLQQPWDDVLLFYARAVGVLKKREAAKRNSWAFFGGMHADCVQARPARATPFRRARIVDLAGRRTGRARRWDRCAAGRWDWGAAAGPVTPSAAAGRAAPRRRRDDRRRGRGLSRRGPRTGRRR